MRAAIIAGGRDYTLGPKQRRWLDGLQALAHIDLVISGAADGADAGGEVWAKMRGIEVVQFPADWKTHGRAAGPLRNEQMAKHAAYVTTRSVALCILFPGGAGTASMRRLAVANKLKIIEYSDKESSYGR